MWSDPSWIRWEKTQRACKDARVERDSISPEKLRAARALANLSQRAAARAIGVQENTISRWETGESVPSRAPFLRMLEAYGLPSRETDLFDDVDELRRRVAELESAVAKLVEGGTTSGPSAVQDETEHPAT